MPADLNAQRIDLLEGDSLIRLFKKFDEVNTPLDKYFGATPQDGDGQSVAWEVLEFSRTAAPVTTRGAQPTPATPPVRQEITAKPITISESIHVPPNVLADLRAPGETQRANGEIWLRICMQQLRNQLLRRRQIHKAQALGANSSTPGSLQFRLPKLNADTTVALGYLDTHMTIGTAWDDADTDIMADLQTARLLAARDSGRMPSRVLTTSHVMYDHIVNNNTVYAVLSDEAKNEVRQTGRLQRLVEMDFELIDEQYDSDGAGTMTGIFPDHFVCVLPPDPMNRDERECKPVSPHAPDGARGLFMHTWYEAGLVGGAWIEYEWTGLPVLYVPDEIVFDVDVTA